MAILVTGGLGFIGSHTCVELLNAGHDVVIVDNASNSKVSVVDRIHKITERTLSFHLVDLLDKSRLKEVFSQHSIDTVIHFAGLKAVGESVAEPLKYYRNNVGGTLTLLEVMQEFGVHKIVFSSSATVYGMQERVPITEDMPLDPVNPYGRTKWMIEHILQDLFVANPQWSIALLRYFNPVGAHESGLIGEDPNGIPNNLFPFVTQVAVGKLKELGVYGDDYPTADGTGVRDYIHVVDLALGHLDAMEWVKDHHGVEAFNLGTGKGYSVLEIVHTFERATGVKIPYLVVGRRPGDVAVSYADAAKAKQVLGWNSHRDLEAMCQDAWRWQTQNPNGFE